MASNRLNSPETGSRRAEAPETSVLQKDANTLRQDSLVDDGRLYAPLAKSTKQLRLVTILPAEDRDALECLLEFADLGPGSHPSYETISYCWGDSDVRSFILVNGASVSVPKSSAAALKRMRLTHARRVVWLDAICINQRDDQERSQQVAMMGDIYRHGVRNLICLGEQNIDQALQSVKAILDEIRADPGCLKRMRNEAGTWQYADTSMTAEYDVAALVELFSIGWFRRMWVLQEAALAKENMCYCGTSEFELLDLTRVAAWLVFNYYFVDPHLRLQCSYAADMNDMVDRVYGYHNTRTGHPASILYLLDLAQQRLCSVAVDKVYGILGLTADAQSQSRLVITPDYSKSTAEVYREVAWSLMKESGDLQILDYVRHWTSDGGIELDDFASWVPKWHRAKDLEEHPNFMSLMFDACLGKKATFHEPQSTQFRIPGVLTVSGARLACVAQMTERIKVAPAAQAQYLANILSHIKSLVGAMLPGLHESLDEKQQLAVATTVCAGVDARYQPAGEGVLKSYFAFRDRTRQGKLLPSMSDLDNTHHEEEMLASQFAEAMYNACMNRRFFVTSTGHFGLGPHFMKQGDVVAVLYGLQWPAVLRPIGDEYLFLGTTYIHGIMYGEAVRNAESVGAVDKVFCIR